VIAKVGCHNLKGARQSGPIHQLAAALVLPPPTATAEAPCEVPHQHDLLILQEGVVGEILAVVAVEPS
jgi:hypothetical protein